MRPCAVQLDAQKGASLSWPEVRDSEYVWDFDDGGTRTDADGFLAAVVYETAGTYHPTVTVDGETWNVQTIVVTEPTETRCVSLTSNWTGCPSGAGHYTSVSAGLSGLRSSTHVLFHRGESYGSQNLGGYANVGFGAYGTGAKPLFSSSGKWSAASEQSWTDLELASTSSDNAIGVAPTAPNALLYRMTVTNSVAKAFSASGEFFIMDSDLRGADYGIYVQGNTKPIGYAVVKGSKISRSNAGQHTSRIEGGHHILYQNSSFSGPGNQTSSVMRRGTEWVLFQDNYMNQPTEFGENGYSSQYFLVERNILDVDTSPDGTDAGLEVVASNNSIVRNNVIINSRGGWALNSSGGATQFINNTVYATTELNFGINAGGAGSTMKNNLVKSTVNILGCFEGGTGNANNWCRSTNECLDPATGGSACYEPNFMSLAPGNEGAWPASADFMRPSGGARGIDQGNQSVPVWDDLDNAPRTMVDVGAVESN
jgi:Right handed beta helix region